MGETRHTKVKPSTTSPGGELDEEGTKTVTFQHHQETHTGHESNEENFEQRSKPQAENESTHSTSSDEEISEQRSKRQTSMESTRNTSERLRKGHAREDPTKEASEQRTRERARNSAHEQHDKTRTRRDRTPNRMNAYWDHLKNIHRAQSKPVLRRPAASKQKQRLRLLKYNRISSHTTPPHTDRYGRKNKKVSFSFIRFFRRHAAGIAGALLCVLASGLLYRHVQARRLLRERVVARRSLAPGEALTLSVPEAQAPRELRFRELVEFAQQRLPPCPPVPKTVLREQLIGRRYLGEREPVPVRATSRRELEWPYSDPHPAVALSGELEDVFDISPRFFPESEEEGTQEDIVDQDG